MTVGREDIEFEHAGERIAAWLYRPADAGDRTPCVVMGHGFSATKDAGLDPYARRFAQAGMAVLAFDYRHFGASSGEPRQLLNIKKQHEDWHAAIRHARALDGVDPGRIALWGTSFAGGHVIDVAATDGNVQAVVTQVPFVDGLATLRVLGPASAVKATVHGLRDGVHALLGRPPHMVPAVGRVGDSFAVMQQPGNYDGFMALTKDAPTWRNQVAGRVLLVFALYRPGRKAAKVRCPILFVVGEEDNLTPAGAARKAAAAAPAGKVVSFPAGHFDPYSGDVFEQNVAEQTAFLSQVLEPHAVAVASG